MKEEGGGGAPIGGDGSAGQRNRKEAKMLLKGITWRGDWTMAIKKGKRMEKKVKNKTCHRRPGGKKFAWRRNFEVSIVKNPHKLGGDLATQGKKSARRGPFK